MKQSVEEICFVTAWHHYKATFSSVLAKTNSMRNNSNPKRGTRYISVGNTNLQKSTRIIIVPSDFQYPDRLNLNTCLTCYIAQ